MESRFHMQFDGVITNDALPVSGESPVVDGQSLTGRELFRRTSSGLPVGCAVRIFDKVNPYLDKFQVYDNIGAFKLRHGMVDSDQIVEPGNFNPLANSSPDPPKDQSK